jgi:aminopeptidase N
MTPATPGQPNKEPVHIPLSFALILDNGQIVEPASVTGGIVTGDVLHLTERKQSFAFSGISSRPVLSLNRSFSAPINLVFDQSADDLAHIGRHDSDLFSRWQALTDLAMPNLTQAARAARGGKDISCDPAFVSALLECAADATLEPAFRAQVLNLPSEADIARALGSDTDPDAIHAGRKAIHETIAKAGEEIFIRLYNEMKIDGAYSPDATDAGKRSLRSAALSYLTYAEGTPSRAAEAFGAADNMTDLAQSLTLLAHRFPDAAETTAALASFLTRFDGNPLVIDKWFSIQATIPGGDALERVKSLTENPRFNAGNPNRVRSLVGTFAFANPTGFNRVDGKGYDFLAEQILTIDPKNPQLAARILTSMRSWQSLEPVRADKARAALAKIAKASKLSTDVRDIVERMLKG